ncbi:beta-ketoacyl synthase N-terminal-like domain-containing protein, partial [Streptomyces sp. 6N223]|uniref:beta-ketoacyl synthase N-terminal-like domain-containing protein n=1 Tax=Streptomyces sp. 6N223 TaxID=3457412 RepID=UPI003FCFBB6F
ALTELADHLDAQADALSSVSHTLMSGRHHFDHRCALIVHDHQDAVRLLRNAAQGETPLKVHRGTVARDFTPNAAMAEVVQELVDKAADPARYQDVLAALADFYCQGYSPKLHELFAERPALVALPTYPFEPETYWAPEPPDATTTREKTGTRRLHPLVHENTSDMTCQRFTSLLDGVLTVGAQLEMARAAVRLSTGDDDRIVELRDVACLETIDLGGQEKPVPVHVVLFPGEGEAIEWAVQTDEGVCTTGRALRACATGGVERIDLAEVDENGLLRLEPASNAEGDGLALVPSQVNACLGTMSGGESLAAICTVRFHGSGPAAWAAVEPAPAASAIRLYGEDGTLLTELVGIAFEESEAATVAEVVVAAAGPGRRAVMAGWSVGQCLEWELKDAVSGLLKLPADKLDESANLQDYGFDSISLVEFAGVLVERLGVDLTPDVFFSFPTLAGLAGHLLDAHGETVEAFYRDREGGHAAATPTPGRRPAPELRRRVARRSTPAPAPAPAPGAAGPIAIVGMSGRFPGARSVDELWSVLAEGRCVVGEMPRERREWWSPEAQAVGVERRIGAIPGAAEFDPQFFEISPREAEVMDPRQRLLLEEMWRALEDAGYGERTVAGEKVGVFVGVEEGDYRLLVGNEGSVTSNTNSILASRLAYFLNLAGPSMAINTSCSSGLVALHEACLSLRYGDCDTAIVAGANILTDPRSYDAMAEAGMLSQDGTTYAFDRRANGMVPGEAVAVLVLKKQHAAERDGHRVHASILGSGVNYDGRTNGITAPSGKAQARLLTEVYERAEVVPDTLDYIVTHGTGTRLGDPIEINALVDAVRTETDRTGFCALTSTKPNVGHTQAASGLVGVIGLALAMRHEVIPPSIHCEELSDYIRWEDSPFFVNREPRPWPHTRDGRPRRGGVSSFGFSGTNAHVILQAHGTAREDRAALEAQPAAPTYLLPVSAKTAEALGRALAGLADHLEAQADAGAGYLASVSHTLMSGRHHFAHRCALVVRDRDDAVRLLRQAAQGETPLMVYRGTVARDFAPNAAVTGFIRDLVDEAPGARRDHGRHREILQALADFYCQGHAVPFHELFEQAPTLISLPTYPFAARHLWIGGHRAHTAEAAAPTVAPAETDEVITLRPVAEMAARMANDAAVPERTARRITLLPLPASASEPASEPLPEPEPVAAASSVELLGELRASLARELFVEVDEVDVEASFTELGLDSIVGVEWVRAVNRRFGTSVGTTRIYQYPNLLLFAEYLAGEIPTAPDPAPAPDPTDGLDRLLSQVYDGDIDVLQATAALAAQAKEA